MKALQKFEKKKGSSSTDQERPDLGQVFGKSLQAIMITQRPRYPQLRIPKFLSEAFGEVGCKPCAVICVGLTFWFQDYEKGTRGRSPVLVAGRRGNLNACLKNRDLSHACLSNGRSWIITPP
jgi:hypothetical protein